MQPLAVPGADFCRGNAIKYLWRLGQKNPAIEETRKAIWYLERIVEQFQQQESIVINSAYVEPEASALADLEARCRQLEAERDAYATALENTRKLIAERDDQLYLSDLECDGLEAELAALLGREAVGA